VFVKLHVFDVFMTKFTQLFNAQPPVLVSVTSTEALMPLGGFVVGTVKAIA
jgi:hypothetical protein